jgi:hypothetical protein
MKAKEMKATYLKALAAVSAVGAFGVLGAAPALAGTATPLYGSGSSLQNNAQTTLWGGNTGSTGWQVNGGLTGPFTFSYNPTSSGNALDEFGNNTGTLDPTKDPLTPTFTVGGTHQLDGFVGTDDAPSSTQLTSAASASGASELTIPVALTSVAVPVSLPVGVSLASGAKLDIQNKLLDEALLGTVPASTDYPANSWGAFLEDQGVSFTDASGVGGSDGRTPISVEVRVGTSGTSFIFKNYLNQVDTLLGGTAWSSFKTGAESWPDSSIVTDNGGTNTGGGALALSVLGTPGTLGYVAISDAVGKGFTNTEQTTTTGGSHEYLYAQMEDNGVLTTSSAQYVDPLNGTASAPTGANVDTTQESQWTGIPTGTGSGPASASWSNVVVSNPNVANTTGLPLYSIAGLTYDLAWTNYESTTLTAAYTGGGVLANPEATVKNYLQWVTATGTNKGQSAITSKAYYAPLPTNTRFGFSQSIQADAVAGANAIG